MLLQAVYIPWIQELIFEVPFLDRLLSSARQFLSITKAQSSTRIEGDDTVTERKDIMSTLLEAKNPSTGEPLPEKELVSEAVILLIAGKNIIVTALANQER